MAIKERSLTHSGVILALGPHTTLELFDASQAAFVDRMEVDRWVRGPVRLALSVQDVEALAGLIADKRTAC